jgi:hypothetical protein
VTKSEKGEEYKFTGFSLQCQECHQDVHGGQFSIVDNVGAGQSKDTNCARCHTPNNWTPDKFDHNRNSSFKLDGAHLKVACAGCHKETVGQDKPVRIFKPLDKSCSSCHGGKDFQDSGGKS